MKVSCFIYALYFGLAGLLVSCGSNGSAGQKGEDEKVSATKKSVAIPDATNILASWSKENIIVNHVVGEADHLHPFNSQNATKTWIHGYIHNFILRPDFITATMVPDLAVSMPDTSDDGLRYTYTLRKDATWDDGSPVSVEDVVFSIKACKSPLTNNAFFKSYINNIKTVETDANDPQKFTVVMKTVYIANINMMGDFPIIQRKFYDPQNVLANYTMAQFDAENFSETAGKDITDWSNDFNNIAKYGNDPAYIKGSGPYQVVEWNRGQSLILQRKPNHWTSKITKPGPYEAAYPEKIIFKIVQDDNAAMLELKSQTLDVSTWLTTKSLIALQQDSDFNANYNSRFTDMFNYNYIAMNMKPENGRKPFFTDVKVRRAMALLVPCDDIIQIVGLGKSQRQASFIAPTRDSYNSDLKPLPYDVEQAKVLLDEAGWKDTDNDGIRDKVINGEKVQFSFDFSYMLTQKFVGDIALMVSESMQKAGIMMNLKPQEPNLMYENAKQHNFDMYMGSWATSSFPEDYTPIWRSDEWAKKGANYTGFGNAESDALIDSIKVTLDTEKRNAMEKRLQKMVYDEQPYVFVYAPLRKNVIHKRFGNQYMTFERPGVILNYYKLLSLYGKGGVAMQTTDMQ